MKKKGFTLIELLAVLVILAILALITIPIVLSIIKNAKENSYKRSIETYGKAVETAIAEYQINHSGSEFPKTISEYEVKTSGNNVKCDDDIEWDGTNGLIVLTGCYVADKNGNPKSKKNYIYNGGALKISYQKYVLGDTFEIKGDTYYIIADSGAEQDYVTALKANLLTEEEINLYGKNIINQYVPEDYDDYKKSADNVQGGGMRFYNSSACGYVDGKWYTNGCTSVYDNSDIKKVIDNWAENTFKNNELKKINGYRARLINEFDTQVFGYKKGSYSYFYPENEYEMTHKYVWFWNTHVITWTMIPDTWYTIYVYGGSSIMWGASSNYLSYGVRPVINVYKSAIQ